MSADFDLSRYAMRGVVGIADAITSHVDDGVVRS